MRTVRLIDIQTELDNFNDLITFKPSDNMSSGDIRINERKWIARRFADENFQKIQAHAVYLVRLVQHWYISWEFTVGKVERILREITYNLSEEQYKNPNDYYKLIQNVQEIMRVSGSYELANAKFNEFMYPDNAGNENKKDCKILEE